MDPIRLQLENFCRHGISDISFKDFSSAIIIGKNKGNSKFANGVGKSTIFYAVEYVLFNKVPFSTLERAIRKGTDFCKVSFDFRSAFDGDVYRIIRSKNKQAGSEVRLFKQNDNSWDDITQRRNADTEKEIAKLIKINYRAFCDSVLFSQSDLSGIASLTPRERKLSLKDALQLNVYSKYEKATKKLSDDLVKEIEKCRTIRSTLGNPAKDIVAFESEILTISQFILDKNKSLDLFKAKISDESERMISMANRIECFERESKESIIRQKSIHSEMESASLCIRDYKNKISDLVKSGKLLSEEIESVEKKIQAATKLVAINKKIYTSEIENISQLIIDKKSSCNSLQLEIKDLKIPLPMGKICKSCRQKVNFSDPLACQKEIDGQIANKELELAHAQNQLLSLESELKKTKGLLKEHDEAELVVSSNSAHLSANKKEIQDKQLLYKEYCTLLEKNNLLFSNKQVELVELKNNADAINEHSNLKNQLISIQKSHTNNILLLENLNKTMVELLNNKAVLSHKIEEKNKDIEKINKCIEQISLLDKKFSLHQKVVQAFGPDGIPALITHTILDDYQLESNSVLSKLRPGLQLKFSVIKDRDDGNQEDTLDISYIIDGDDDMEYEQLSGAQKLLVSLSLKLGLASIIKKRLGTELKFLLIDEIDQSLDEGTVEAFEAAIKELQKEFKILVITHNNELKDKFNHAILVEQDENFISTAKVVNFW